MSEASPTPEIFDPKAVSILLDHVGRDDEDEVIVNPVLTMEDLRSKLASQDHLVLDRLLELKPEPLGFLGPFETIDEPPSNLVELPGFTIKYDGFEKTVKLQHLPAPAKEAFDDMATEVQQATGSMIFVESGYRSPAAQAVVFFLWLEKHKFDLRRTAAGVALPGYSQHGDPIHTAIDVMNHLGQPTDQAQEEFALTDEYKWLTENAGRYGFSLSYAKDNQWGVIFEPWHWRYVGR